ncbi:arsenate reductase (glutaredoxin) [Brevundimonas goettingensis]|uniref:Arsenate reductase n=1 Tax=Brevundimonas goettingensis TaxID=2774190 RepID=A0A975GW27_9CAUL|nr:arsenate reductase (glutaredoxin) [Brevundimonas goettingensis]QTC91328.1 arsenate reductase (glutaredoxin) [Brevundimonas goettingensis]
MSDANFPVVIFHNPACGTSRNVVTMVRAAGYEPTVVDYLQTGWTRDQLLGLATRAGLGLKDLMREKGTPAAELGLLAGDVTDEQILDAMLAHPILVNRPIVQTPKGVKLCRPSEVVFDLLEQRPDVFVKEDGKIVRF